MTIAINSEPLLEGLMNSLSDFRKGFIETVEDIINQDPFCGHDFYIFGVLKLKSRDDLTHRFINQATLLRPNPMPGSTCLKVNINTKSWDLIWTLPLEEFMDDFNSSMFDHPDDRYKNFVLKCIRDYKNGSLNPKVSDDPSKEEIEEVLKSMKLKMESEKRQA